MTHRNRGRISVSPDLLVETMPDGNSVFLQLKTEEYFGLDQVGTRMWTILTDGHSIEEAHGRLLAEYEVESDRLRGDLDELVAQLLAHGFITLVDP